MHPPDGADHVIHAALGRRVRAQRIGAVRGIALQRATEIGNRVREHGQVVPPLKKGDDPSIAQPFGQREHRLRQFPEPVQRQAQPRQRIIPVRVEARRDED